MYFLANSDDVLSFKYVLFWMALKEDQHLANTLQPFNTIVSRIHETIKITFAPGTPTRPPSAPTDSLNKTANKMLAYFRPF